jgi:hypothetical protein
MTKANASSRSSTHTGLGLRAGDWVIVRSASDILATLDDRGCLEALPFQPEMLAWCGQRMRVAKSAHKTCDTIHKTGGRRMLRAVHLEGARCDGSVHGNCQADCVFFWKEAWLERATPSSPERTPMDRSALEAIARTLHPTTRSAEPHDAHDPIYVCQTTALYAATQPLAWWDVRQYVRDVTSGNHSAWRMTKLLAAAGFRNVLSLGIGYGVLVRLHDAFQRIAGGKPYPTMEGTIPKGKATPAEVKDLRPGEWVVVKPLHEIAATITVDGFNRGMRYDPEMAKYSGERHRVQMRVERLINEQTGRMTPMKSACIQLEDVYCRAECTSKRVGCPRASNTYWREIWLDRA